MIRFFKRFFDGINIVPNDTTKSKTIGDIEVRSNDYRLYYHNGLINDAVVTENSFDRLSNKIIDTNDMNQIMNIGDSSIAHAANIQLNKLYPLMSDMTVVSDNFGVLTSGPITATELGYLSGLPGPINDILKTKATIGGDSVLTTMHLGTTNNQDLHLISNNASKVVISPTDVNIDGPLYVDGQIYSNSGTALLPSKSFLADTNTGIYNPAPDQIGFTTNGSLKMVVNELGHIGLGTTTPDNNIVIVDENPLGTSAAGVDVYGYNGTGPSFRGFRARGTINAPEALLSGDGLMTFGGLGYNGTGFATATRANVVFRAAENWTPTAMGTSIEFGTTALGTNDRTAKLYVGPSNIGILNTNPTEPLDVNGNILTRGLLKLKSTSNTNELSISAPALSSSYSLTLPVDAGSSGQALITDGSGNLSWSTPSQSWNLTGNTGTSPSTNFIGTTDNQDLVIRTNNTASLTVTSGGNLLSHINGSTANAAYSFSGDTNTGIYRIGPDSLGLAAGGTAARLDAGGRLTLGGESSTNFNLFLRKRMDSNDITVCGMYQSSTIAGASTTEASGIQQYLTVASGTNLNNLYYNNVNQGTFSGSVANQYGYHVEYNLIGATNNYGFYSSLGNAAGRWNFYASGTAPNFFRGNTGFGAVTANAPQTPLHIIQSSSDAKIRLQSSNAGQTTFGQTSAGLEMTATGMSTTAKYTPALKFGSTDPQLTTTNPKFNAAIVGYATEIYDSDDDTGMGLEFFTSPNSGGVGGALTSAMVLDNNQNLGIGKAPTEKLDVVGNIQATGALKLVETGAGTDTVSISAPSAVTSSYELKLPAAQGASGTSLVNDGSGNLSWAPSGGAAPTYNQTLNNNQTSPADITDMLFDDNNERKVSVNYYISRVYTSDPSVTECGTLVVLYNAKTAQWDIVDNQFSGDDAGVTFSVTALGQVQYITTDMGASPDESFIRYKLEKL